MKTTSIHTSDKRETTVALTFIATLFLLLLAVSNIMAAPNKMDKEAFTVDCNNQQAIIKWNIRTEKSDVYYTVERTQDGVNYELVSDIQAIAGSSLHQYSVVDENPLKGIAYYRISETNEGGKKHYLNTVVYTPCQNEESIDASNKASNILIRVNSNTNDSCSIVLKSTDGKVVFSENRKVSLGLNNFNIEPNINKGVYVLYVTYSSMKLNMVFVLE